MKFTRSSRFANNILEAQSLLENKLCKFTNDRAVPELDAMRLRELNSPRSGGSGSVCFDGTQTKRMRVGVKWVAVVHVTEWLRRIQYLWDLAFRRATHMVRGMRAATFSGSVRPRNYKMRERAGFIGEWFSRSTASSTCRHRCREISGAFRGRCYVINVVRVRCVILSVGRRFLFGFRNVNFSERCIAVLN